MGGEVEMGPAGGEADSEEGAYRLEEERATVFFCCDGIGAGFSLLEGRGAAFVRASASPATIGGGRFKFSVAFLESCVAKSEACHHSRNLSAKMEVGSRSLSAESSFGITTVAIATGLNMLVLAAALWPVLLAPEEGGGAIACAIAW